MRITRRLALLGATAIATMTAAASPALASTEPAAGAFTEGPETITSAQFADGNEIYTLTREAVFSGSYAGIGLVDQRIVIHKDGSANVQMTIDFTGTACGQAATLTFQVAAQVDFVTNTMTGHYTVQDSGPSSQHSPRGNGTFTGVPGAGGSYEGQIHCD